MKKRKKINISDQIEKKLKLSEQVRQKRITGIDPGVSGAAVTLDGMTGDIIAQSNLPFVKTGKRNRLDSLCFLTQLKALHKPDIIIIEDVAARPGNGAAAMFAFGEGAGRVQGVCTAYLENDVILVTPQKWQGCVLPVVLTYKDMLHNDPKQRARLAASVIWPGFPDLKNSGYVDAALIALSYLMHPDFL